MLNVGLTLQGQVASSCETVFSPHARFSAAYLIKTESSTRTFSVHWNTGEPWFRGYIPVISCFPWQEIICYGHWWRSNLTHLIYCADTDADLEGEWVHYTSTVIWIISTFQSVIVKQKRTRFILVGGTCQIAFNGPLAPLMCIWHPRNVMYAYVSVCGLLRGCHLHGDLTGACSDTSHQHMHAGWAGGSKQTQTTNTP